MASRRRRLGRSLGAELDRWRCTEATTQASVAIIKDHAGPKHCDRPYQSGRSKHWIKVKNRITPLIACRKRIAAPSNAFHGMMYDSRRCDRLVKEIHRCSFFSPKIG